MHIPIFLDLSGWSVLIIGGGEIAARKAKELLNGEAEITLLAPERAAVWEEIPCTWQQTKYAGQPLDGYQLVVAATDNKQLNAEIAAECRRKNILCNSASDPQNGRCILPGVVRSGGYTVAISSNGRTPFLTKKLKKTVKDAVQSLLEAYDEQTIALLGEVRAEIIKNYPNEKAVLLARLADMPPQLIREKTHNEKGNYNEIIDWLKGEQAGADPD
jgi:siroheme synthase-like protein